MQVVFSVVLSITLLLCAFCSADDVHHDTRENVPGSSASADGFLHTPSEPGSTSRARESSNRTSSIEDNLVDYEEELKLKQAEALRQRQMEGRKQDGLSAVRRTINAASSDWCDWKTQPLSFIKGEVCGSHYKVLGIDRKSKLTDKTRIKKKYRQLSLQLHPDKNPAPDADDAFTVLQGAYNCILDDSCKQEYDQRLTATELAIAENRQRLKRVVINKALIGLNQAHYYVSLAANKIYETGLNFWEAVGEWRVTVLDESYPVGRPLALILLLWKGQFLLKLQALSYVVVRLNYEIAKARGWV